MKRTYNFPLSCGSCDGELVSAFCALDWCMDSQKVADHKMMLVPIKRVPSLVH